MVLKPGAMSSQRQWHEGEDEFLVTLEGEAVLIEESGEPFSIPGTVRLSRKGSRMAIT